MTDFLWFFVLGALLFTIVEEVLYWQGEDSLVWLHNLYSFFHLAMMTLVFSRLLPDRTVPVFVIGGLLFLASCLEHVFIEDMDAVVVLAEMGVLFAVGLGSLVGFYDIFIYAEEEFIFKNPVFWVFSGSLIYATGSLFSVGLADRIFTFEDTAITGMWGLHNLFNALRYLFFALAFIVMPIYQRERMEIRS